MCLSIFPFADIVYEVLCLDCKPKGGVHIKFNVVGVVIELLLTFIDVVFFVEDNNCGPFVRGFNNHVPTLSKFAKGNPFIGCKVVDTLSKLLIASTKFSVLSHMQN